MKTNKRTALALACLSLLACALPCAAQQGDAGLSLVCPGTGQHLESHSSYGSEWDPKKHKYVDSNRTSMETTDVQGTVQVEIRGDMGRIHPPKRLVPPLSSGDQDGWWPLTELEVTPDRIHARFRMNGLNKPQITIDRRSGHLTLEGVENFEGDCNAVDPNARKF
jgi:hypothetical protein